MTTFVIMSFVVECIVATVGVTELTLKVIKGVKKVKERKEQNKAEQPIVILRLVVDNSKTIPARPRNKNRRTK